MKASELRIGNIVTVNNPVSHPKLKGVMMEVTSIHESGNREEYTHGIGLRHINQIPNQYYETYSQFVRFVDSIELTAELLLKLGFKRFESDGLVEFDNFKLDGKTICDKRGKFTIVQCGDNASLYFSSHGLRVKLTTVHQLQNLYFAILGNELTINE